MATQSHAPGPGILDLVQHVQISREEDPLTSNPEWNSFTILCELLATVVVNKIKATSPDARKAEAELRTRFSSFTSNTERVNFVLEDSNIRPVLEFYVHQVRSGQEKTPMGFKHAQQAKVLIRGADDLATGSEIDIRAAVDKYAEAIRFAPLNSSTEADANNNRGPLLASNKTNEPSLSVDSELVLAYAGRSRALFSLGRFEDAIADIEVALSLNCSPERAEELRERKEKCTKCIDKNSTWSMTQRIYSKRKITTLSKQLANGNNFLELSTTPDKGRHVVVNRNVQPNEILLDERPFAAWLKPSLVTQYCYHCLTTLRTVHGCFKCSKVSYCSNKCKVESWLQYHSAECENLDILEKLSKGHFALRIVLIAGLARALDLHEQFNEEKYVLEAHENTYSSIYILVDHQNDFEFEDMLQIVLGAVFMGLLSRDLGLVDKDKLSSLSSLLLKHLLQMHLNGIQIMRQDIVDPSELEDGQFKFAISQEPMSIGFGLYPTLSLLNHSCFNTLKSLFNGSQITFVSSKDIAKGDEITFNYGPHYKCSSRDERREHLRRGYFFTCQCKACVENWT